MEVFFLFLLATALGCLTTLYWIPEDDLGRGYFQMNALVILGLWGLAVAVATLHPFEPFASRAVAGRVALWGTFAAAFFYYFTVWQERWSLGRWPLSLSLAGATTTLVLAGQGLPLPGPELPGHGLLLLASLLASALLLGWSLVTMLLGHWYLVAPKLAFRHLVVFCQIVVAAVMLRFFTLGASLVQAWRVDPLVEPNPLRMLVGSSGQGMFFWIRLLWGLAIPLTLGLMALHCARRRSNQSATGILYVLVVGAFVGEITAYYLTLTTGVPA